MRPPVCFSAKPFLNIFFFAFPRLWKEDDDEEEDDDEKEDDDEEEDRCGWQKRRRYTTEFCSFISAGEEGGE